MCGICGFIQPEGSQHHLESMAATLSHRGPDDVGFHLEELSATQIHEDCTETVGLGHRRLSIIDLSSAGRQPLFNEDASVSAVFNGEIYNYRELRQELEASGHRFRSETDSEVIVHGYEEWGHDLFARLNGMFAIAIWDRRLQKLVLARDRVGIKPLYYYTQDRALLFASETGALVAHPLFKPVIDRESLGLYLDFSYVPAPRTIFLDTYKVMPGELVIWQGNAVRTERYWMLDPSVEETSRTVLMEDAKAQCSSLIRDSVSRRLMSDVPLGAFLSGGYDSSLVVAMMKSAGAREVDTFSIGFEESEYNEAPEARKIARHLGTRHHEFTVTAHEALNALEHLAHIYDEPFGDPSALPTYLVSKFARSSGMAVALSGDGGDELFCGYTRYRTTARLHRISELPAPVRRVGRAFLRRTPSQRWRRLAANTDFDTLADLYHHRMSTWKDGNPYSLVRPHWLTDELSKSNAADLDHETYANLVFEQTTFRRLFNRFAGHETANLLSLVDVHTYLVDDILTKVDRASMAVSLEVRVPLLDHRLVEFAASLPLHLKTSGGDGKLLLKAISADHIPPELLKRPKRGFAIPVERWLRGPLRSRFERALAPEKIAAEGLLNPEAVAELTASFLNGSAHCARLAWSLFTFELWLEKLNAVASISQEDRDDAPRPQKGVHADSELLPTGGRF